jgi:hypothetical protein
MFWRRESRQEKKEQAASSPLLPPTVNEVLRETPDLCPIQGADFTRVQVFFHDQITYYSDLAEADPEKSGFLYDWAQRIPELFTPSLPSMQP